MRPPVEPMHAIPAGDLPAGMVYEPKWDGWRCLAFIQPGRVVLQSRHLKILTPYFPDITRLLRTLAPGVVLDGELIVWDPVRERTNFVALQKRIVAGRWLLAETTAKPAHYVVFDALHDAVADLTGLPLVERRARLEFLLTGAPPNLQLCPQTLDPAEARTWMRDWQHTGVEGVVCKDPAGRYVPGGRAWVKVKTRNTTEAIVGGVTGTPSAPGSLLLGRYDAGGRLRYVGITNPIPAAHRAELGQALVRYVAQRRGAAIPHPWPIPLPAAWSGQLGERRPLNYVPVQPTVVVEVLVDAAFDEEAGRWRHRPTFVRVRADLSPYDVTRAAGF
ncbi:ATP-dependent DNA ligase [Dactylosporangium sucinum]|uniref:ATP-dependent DNA ligase n=1 Tax=Dactylosporangium sucinum TaxID=1424081 RepID=A0A917U4K3_9ACTN|nr:ATP-dependent DNA ligase [Dactylosporangium sucinum]GGM52927.1 ATP-dependent DNA ligase [Dactylosporangium sucinum]